MMWPWPDGDPFFPMQTPPETLDARLTRSVAERLRAHPAAGRASVMVEVQNGVAMLSGSTGTPEIRRAVVATAHDTPGIRDVCDMLAVAPREAAGGRAAGAVGSPAGRGTGVAVAGAVGLPAGRMNGIGTGGSAASTGARVTGIAAAVWLAGVLIVALGWAGALIGGLIAAVLCRAFRRAGPPR